MGKKSGHGEVEISYARRDHHAELLDMEEERALDDASCYDPYDHCTDEQRARYYPMGFHKGYERNVEGECLSVPPREGHELEASTTVRLVAVKMSALKMHKKHQQHVAASQETVVQEKEGEQPRTSVSRKERKKRAAQLRATTAPLFCDSVMRGDNSGTSTTDSDRTVMPHFVSHPLRGLPADVILNVLVMYLPPQDIKALMIASVGADLLMKANETVWQQLFEEQQMGRTYSDRLNKLRRQMFEAGADEESKLKKWSYIVRHITRMAGPATLSDKQHEEQQRCFDSEGSAIVRALMKEKTAVWETQEIVVFEHYRTGARHPFNLPLVKNFSFHPFSWRRRPNLFFLERARSSDYKRYMCRRSEAFPKQCACNHQRVVLDVDRHWFVCLDCRLYTHAGFDRQDIWHQDGDALSTLE